MPSRDSDEEIYRYRRNLYGKNVNKWLEGYPKAPVAKFMEAGGRLLPPVIPTAPAVTNLNVADCVIFNKTLTVPNAGWAGFTFVQTFNQGGGNAFPLAGSTGANQIRFTLTFTALSAGAQMTGCYFGLSSTGGADNSINFNGDQVQVTFNGSGTITGNGTTLVYTSDWITLAQNFNLFLIYNIAFQFVGGTSNIATLSGVTNCNASFKAGADAATTTKVGYSGFATNVANLVSKVELRSSPTVSYFSNDGSTFPWYTQPTFPAAAYDSNTNKTWFCWEGMNIGLQRFVIARNYDHTNTIWSGIYPVAAQPLTNDDHGVPSIVRDADGYWHIFHGPHGGPILHEVTTAPDDITAWTHLADLGTTLEYFSPVMVGSTLHLLTREDTTPGHPNDEHLAHFSASLIAGVATWSSETSLIDTGDDTRIYWGNTQLRNSTEIHFILTVSDGAKTFIRNFYYAIYNTTNGSVKNISGSFSVPAGSLPVNQAQLDANFLIYANDPAGSGSGFSLVFDTNGTPHALVSNAATVNAAEYDLFHLVYSGGSWSSPVKIGQIPSNNSDVALVAEANGAISAYYPVAAQSFTWGGDLYRRYRTSSGQWLTASLVQAASSFALNEPVGLVSPNSHATLIYTEILQSSLDVTPGAGTLKSWALGTL